MNRSGPVARVTRGCSGPALPCRVSHGDVTICRQSWTGLWPIGQRHQRVQPVPVHFSPRSFSSLPLSSGAVLLPPSHLLPPHFLSVSFIQLSQRAAAEVAYRRFPSADEEWSWLEWENGSPGTFFSRVAVVKVLLLSKEHGQFIRVAAMQGWLHSQNTHFVCDVMLHLKGSACKILGNSTNRI